METRCFWDCCKTLWAESFEPDGPTVIINGSMAEREKQTKRRTRTTTSTPNFSSPSVSCWTVHGKAAHANTTLTPLLLFGWLPHFSMIKLSWRRKVVMLAVVLPALRARRLGIWRFPSRNSLGSLRVETPVKISHKATWKRVGSRTSRGWDDSAPRRADLSRSPHFMLSAARQLLQHECLSPSCA